MDLTPETLREVEFREKLRGYHPDDVDDFLEQVAVALEELLDGVRESDADDGAFPARSEPTRVATPPPPTPPPPLPVVAPPAAAVVRDAPVAPEQVTDDTLRRTLVLAQRTADLAVAEAEDAAREILEHAQVEATRIREEAKAQADATVADVESRRAGLEREVAALQGWAVQHRDRLREALSEQVRSIDVWLAASTPPPSARAGFGRAGAGTRRPLGPTTRALSGAMRRPPTSSDAAPAVETPEEAAATPPEDDAPIAGDAGAEAGVADRVFRRR
ncbi:MAG: DivIVA domain-containing protein [Acidimicrobiales bacterium]